MKISLVLTVVGKDRPGLVENVARTVADQNGNWLESRMSHMADHFAGIVRVEVPEKAMEKLRGNLAQMAETEELRITVEESGMETEQAPSPSFFLELVGTDRPGIVKELSALLSRHGVNIEEMNTETSGAPMSGDPLFHASVKIQLPSQLSVDQLRTELEKTEQNLMVDINLRAENEGKKTT